ncbi:MAG: TIGR03016 family PEP-CTERM system-associated outer membrane protein [Proteobacteria bacterium]|nr:TIGR03016 family PEP-CTERM system-associated outer membrane protein [Pseudomonadota bacterium]
MFTEIKKLHPFFIGIFISLDANAFNVLIEPSISVSETYSDNINLADEGFEDDDFITSVNPEITITSDSRLHRSSLNYVLQKINYINLSRTDSFNTMNTEGEFEFLQDQFFLDYNIRNGQQNISNTGTVSRDNLSINSSRQNVLSYNVHPYWTQRLGVYAFFEAGFDFNEIVSDNNDSTSETIDLSLEHGTMFNRILWDVHFSDKTIENDSGGQKTIFRNLTGNLRYLLTRKFALTASLGYDDNEFQSSDSVSGILWNAGAEWNPSRRTSLAGSIGRRFFGTDYNMQISHFTKKMRFQFSFDQTPETTRSSLLNQQTFNLRDEFGEVITDPDTGLPASLDVLTPRQVNEVLVNRNLEFVTSYNHKKTSMNFVVFFNQRDFQLTEDTENSYGARFSWNWRFSPTLSSNMALSHNIQEPRQGGKSNQTFLDLGITKRLTREIRVNGGLAYAIRDTESTGGNYKETRAFVGLTKDF